MFDGETYVGVEDIARGLGDLETRKTWGKAVVKIRNADGSLVKQRDARARL